MRAHIEDSPGLAELEHQLELMRSLGETNPMLGTRGVRLGVLHPEIYAMQVRTIARGPRSTRAHQGERPGSRS